jgi:hypothetical protein
VKLQPVEISVRNASATNMITELEAYLLTKQFLYTPIKMEVMKNTQPQ